MALVEFWNTSVLVFSINRVQVCVSSLGHFFLTRRSRYNYMEGLATMSNMGAEVGATTSTFPYTPHMRAYLNATGRSPVAAAADAAAAQGFLSADEGAEYDEIIEIVWLTSLRLYKPRLIAGAIFRTFQRSNPLSTDPSLPIWQLLCPSLDPSFKSKVGKMNSQPDLSDHARTARTRIWYVRL